MLRNDREWKSCKLKIHLDGWRTQKWILETVKCCQIKRTYCSSLMTPYCLHLFWQDRDLNYSSSHAKEADRSVLFWVLSSGLLQWTCLIAGNSNCIIARTMFPGSSCVFFASWGVSAFGYFSILDMFLQNVEDYLCDSSHICVLYFNLMCVCVIYMNCVTFQRLV